MALPSNDSPTFSIWYCIALPFGNQGENVFLLETALGKGLFAVGLMLEKTVGKLFSLCLRMNCGQGNDQKNSVKQISAWSWYHAICNRKVRSFLSKF
jgi:hypothetical protein